MAKPIIMGFTDIHLVRENIEEVFKLIEEGCDLSDQLGIDLFFISGDVLDSRVSQRLDVLIGLHRIFDLLEQRGKHALIIPGNHDKTDYKAKESFLDPFAHHPAITLFPEYEPVLVEGVLFHFLPFFEYGCELFNDNLEELLFNVDSSKKNVLIGHMAVEGSVNNDGSKVTGVLNRGQLKTLDLVLLGHYHNTHSIGKNIIHIPSLRQNNFGEDENKGFTVVYEDLELETFSPAFTRYKVYRFNLDTDDLGDIITVSNEIHGNGNRNRFEFTGERERVKGFDGSRFEDMGINVKKKYADLEGVLDPDRPQENLVLNTWTETKIVERLGKFCEKNKLDSKYGLELLTKIMNKRNE